MSLSVRLLLTTLDMKTDKDALSCNPCSLLASVSLRQERHLINKK